MCIRDRRVRIRVTFLTRLNSRELSVEPVARMTSIACQFFVRCSGVHRQPRQTGCHRTQSTAQPHAVFALNKRFRLTIVTIRTRRHFNVVAPSNLLVVATRSMAVGTVDSGCGMRSGRPLLQYAYVVRIGRVGVRSR